MSSLSIEGLVKSYGGDVAVNGLDLEIADGEMLVLLGPSGCGKTTTMRCVVGLERPDAGRIVADGRVLFDAATAIEVPANERGMGMVFQSYAIWPHKTVFENVAFPLKMQRRGRREIAFRVAEMLELVGLTGYEHRGASMLSGCQMQRVALARSLVIASRRDGSPYNRWEETGPFRPVLSHRFANRPDPARDAPQIRLHELPPVLSTRVSHPRTAELTEMRECGEVRFAAVLAASK